MKKGYKITLIILVCLIVLLVSLVQRIDRTPFQKTAHYQEWLAQLPSLTLDSTSGQLQMGWAKENITPTTSTPLSGHGNRWGKHFEVIHDSLYVRAIAIRNPHTTVYFVSADMLIVPPNIIKRLEELLKNDGIPLANIHFGATHTHHGLGGWGEKLAGHLFSGKLDPNIVEQLAQQFHTAIVNSSTAFKEVSKVQYGQYANPDNIYYRIPAEGGQVDDKVRSILFVGADSSSAEIITYAAHATTLDRKFLQISRDYPGPLIDSLEKNDRNFALFYAGAVGSMGPYAIGDSGIERSLNLVNSLYKKHKNMSLEDLSTSLLSAQIAVPMPAATVRISKNYALRPWAFKTFFGENNAYIQATRIGNTLMLGMPADFSGEIMTTLSDYAQERGLHLIITSFNGDYLGYILPDKVYDIDFHETVIMSWNGYQAGGYYTEVAKQIIDKVALP